MGIHLSNNTTVTASASASNPVQTDSPSVSLFASLSHSEPKSTDLQTISSATKRNTVADNVGIWLSIACLAHCLIVPVFATIGAMILPALEHEYLHGILAALILPTTAWAAWHGYHHHRKAKVVLALSAGALIITIAILVGEYLPNELYETAITGAGSMLLITGHWHNRTK